ncbi:MULTISPECIES: PF20097 family protein [unclassified Clostridioides]|uniref:PF20097 family protein n=1 Tax=unclassified Clostridioides TaxID=2635829 RepID=UPI001D0C5497
MCPFCKSKMKVGYIKNSSEILCWTPENGDSGILCNSTGKDGIALAKFSFLKGSKAKAFYCNKCNKCIIDIDDNI